MKLVRIATRGSLLALWQANHIRDALLGLGVSEVELVVVKTQGDLIIDRPLSEVGGKGLFIKEVEEALLDGRADLAVHSLKDLTAEMPSSLMLGAIPLRADPRDALLVSAALTGVTSIAALPSGAKVGTSSIRRTCQLKHARADLEIVPLRGNVDTRLRKLDEGLFDAIILAAAGLSRLGYAQRISATIAPEESLPAVGQGALGLQCRVDDTSLCALCASLHDERTGHAVTAERGFLRTLNGDCRTPLGAYAEVKHGNVRLRGMLATEDGSKLFFGERTGLVRFASEVGEKLANTLLQQRAAG